MNHLHRYKGFICSVVLGAVNSFHDFLGLVFTHPENNSLQWKLHENLRLPNEFVQSTLIIPHSQKPYPVTLYDQ